MALEKVLPYAPRLLFKTCTNVAHTFGSNGNPDAALDEPVVIFFDKNSTHLVAKVNSAGVALPLEDKRWFNQEVRFTNSRRWAKLTKSNTKLMFSDFGRFGCLAQILESLDSLNSSSSRREGLFNKRSNAPVPFKDCKMSKMDVNVVGFDCWYG